MPERLERPTAESCGRGDGGPEFEALTRRLSRPKCVGLCGSHARWCVNRPLAAPSPLAACVSADSSGGRHTEPCHPVKHVAPDFCLGPLIGQNPGVKTPADDGLVAKHRGLNQTSAIIA
jgi:hypothetical protein